MANNVTIHIQSPNNDTVDEIVMVGLIGGTSIVAELVRHAIATDIERLIAQTNWTVGQNFVVGQGVTDSGNKYVCIQDNLSAVGNSPGNTAFWTQTDFVAGTTYAKDDFVASAGIYYTSLVDNNQGNTPAASTAFWREQGVKTFRFNDDIDAGNNVAAVAPSGKNWICDIKYNMITKGEFEIIDTTAADKIAGATFTNTVFAATGNEDRYLETPYSVLKAKFLTVRNKDPFVSIKRVYATLYESTN